jgi:ribosome maturation protein Sdo1
LEVIRQLKTSNNIPIQQAQMRVQLTVPGTYRFDPFLYNESYFFASERWKEIQRKNA